MHPKDPETTHDVVLDSNLGKTIASVSTECVKTIFENKLKSKCLLCELFAFHFNPTLIS